jgi:hypothetical protein
MAQATGVNRGPSAATKRLYAECVGPIYRAKVAVVNDAGIAAADVDRWIAAMRVQVRRDLEPAWSVGADLVQLPAGETAEGCWHLILKPDALFATGGVHEKQARGQFPLATVSIFKGQASLRGWSVTASHELLEMLVNPDARTIKAPRLTWLKRQVRLEVCDPCGDDSCYGVKGVKVANFVYPSWFGRGAGPFDHLGQLPKSFSVTAGGSITLGRSGKDTSLQPDNCPQLARRSGLNGQ